jgi:hypothetical protein
VLTDQPLRADLLHGHADLERTGRGWLPHRLPASARARTTDQQLLGAESQPAGVRLAFRTSATVIEVDLIRTRIVLRGVPERPDGMVDLLVDGELERTAATARGDVVDVDMARGFTEVQPGAPATIEFAGLRGMPKDIEIWLPHNERVELVALRTDAPITPVVDDRRRWLHYGSSISQGSNARNPCGTWPVAAARLAGWQLTNLGLAGSALLDPFVARAMRDMEADAISLKVGINLVNTDLHRLRALGPAVHGFIDTLRDGHPDTPLLVVGPLYCAIHEETPGPVTFDPAALAEGRIEFRATGDAADAATDSNPLGKLTLQVIRHELEQVVRVRAQEDPHIAFLDGRSLYGSADAEEHPLPDALHPDPGSHATIGGRFAQLAFGTGGPLMPGHVAPLPPTSQRRA